MTESEQQRRLDIENREVLLDERETVLDELMGSLWQLDAGHAGTAADVQQARDQMRRFATSIAASP